MTSAMVVVTLEEVMVTNMVMDMETDMERVRERRAARRVVMALRVSTGMVLARMLRVTTASEVMAAITVVGDTSSGASSWQLASTRPLF